MGTISELLKAVRSINLATEIPKIIEETSDTIIKLNQQQLYAQSIDSDGIKLELYSSPIYALDKQRRNPLPGFLHPDLYNSGALYGGMYVAVTPNTFTVGSRDSKEPKVELKYGKAIWGLTKENKAVYSKIVNDRISLYIASKTGLV